MPVVRLYLEEFGMNYVQATEPFVPNDLYMRAIVDIETADPETVLGAPMVLDLRAVDLMRFEAEDFRRLIRRRQSIRAQVPGGPCAFVVTEGSFGMMRMFAIFSEVSGFRKEEMTIVTTELAEAVRWIWPFLDNPAEGETELLATLRRA